MSWACCLLRCMSGMALPGRTACGSLIHRTKAVGVFGSNPATVVWTPKCARDGPTVPTASGTPGTMWHCPQPACAISAAPRCGSPLKGAHSARRSLWPQAASPRQPTAKAMPTAKRVVARAVIRSHCREQKTELRRPDVEARPTLRCRSMRIPRLTARCPPSLLALKRCKAEHWRAAATCLAFRNAGFPFEVPDSRPWPRCRAAEAERIAAETQRG